MYTQEELLNKVNAYLEQLRYNTQPDGLYAPIKYALSLGGKRIRPVLMLMSYNIYKEHVDDILSHAVALETYHNFTLLHDDVMDRAEMRRGKPCVHKVWNDNTAILSGDAMLILAYRLMTEARFSDEVAAEIPSEHLTKALVTFTQATLGVCEGQQYDIEFESREDVSEADYMEMIRLKTSLLLACALKIGAQLAGAPDGECDLLYDFGEKMGLAFQLQDDLLDVYGETSVFGKKIGGDILCNKKTFMLINALNLASKDDQDALHKWIHKTDVVPEEKIEAVKAIYDKIQIRQLCEAKIETLFQAALDSLEKVNVEPAKKAPLVEFAHRLMKRNY